MIIPADNPMTQEGVELGRWLFYEKRLSANDSMSCASCHLPQSSFSDPNKYSTGIDGIAGNRNSMALINLGWDNFFFWDGRASSLEQQILEPIPNPIEMHQSWTDAVYKLNLDINYRNKFYRAFGQTGIDSSKVTKAIAQFIRTMISASSKYDVMYKYENGIALTAQEQNTLQMVDVEEWAGYDLFKSLNGANFTDLGRGGVTGNPEDYGKFKVPTLRNIALSAPYMHDGRFETLDQVIEHYSSGVHVSPTIDPLIEFANQGGVQLSAQEKYLLKKFLLTLTDNSFISNPNFKDPN